MYKLFAFRCFFFRYVMQRKGEKYIIKITINCVSQYCIIEIDHDRLLCRVKVINLTATYFNFLWAIFKSTCQFPDSGNIFYNATK